MAVKANAYGHGAIPVSKTAIEEGVSLLGVATVEEGIELRAAGISAPVILLGLPLVEELPDLVAAGITSFVADKQLIRLLADEAARQNKRLPVHIKVDTGMGRIGCRPEEVMGLAEEITRSDPLFLEGLATHFPVSDVPDNQFTRRQVEQLKFLKETLAKNKITVPLIHAANSGAIVGEPESFFNMVRPGIILYGYYPSAAQERAIPVRPLMDFVTKIVFVKRVPAGTGISYGLTHTTQRETCIATIPVGYGDGYSRLLSNRASVSIRGKRYPVVGRVCMDQTMIDLGPNPDVGLSDDVILFGSAPGGPDAEDIAKLMGTIPYEVTCLITSRVPRVFVETVPYK
jgi:alanine racemase